MDTIQLGATGIEITRLIYGAGSIGGIGGAAATRGLGIDTRQGLERLSEAYGLGIQVIDTADSYGAAKASARWAAGWRSQRPGDVLIQTKVGGVVRAGQSGIDLSGPHIERQIAESIRRLGRVDLYMSHAPDPGTPLEETLTAFAARARGGAHPRLRCQQRGRTVAGIAAGHCGEGRATASGMGAEWL